MPKRLDANDTGWTAERLANLLQAQFAGERLIVVANREPYKHDRGSDGRLLLTHSTSGLVTALEPLVRAASGVWIAHGAGTADRTTVDARDGLDVPPGRAAYRLRRVWLDEEEAEGYYYGFANEGLWPLCHRAHVRPVFRSDDFNTYWTINGRFVDAVVDEAASASPVVLVQDYHFALAPGMIRERLPASTVVTFWHTPWPHWQEFRICPWHRHLLEGLLGSSIIGFQTPCDAKNFIDTVEHSLEAHIDREHDAVTFGGRRTVVRDYAASIEWPNRWVLGAPPVDTCRRDLRRELGLPSDARVILGVDRLDYTKGLEEKLLAVERLLEWYPELRDRIAFVQLAEPSREHLAPYRELHCRLMTLADRINARFGRRISHPVSVIEGHHPSEAVYRAFRAADVCYVGSLHDGMNLVAKEFVSARDDLRGVLVLSAFAGAARELSDAIIINPYDVDAVAQALDRALRMEAHEQHDRMRRMASIIAESDAHAWAGRMLGDAARLRGERQVTGSTAVLYA